MKPVVKIISLIFILMLLIACQHEESDSVVDIQKLVIPVLTESTTLVVGESKKLNIFATKVDNSQEDVTSQVTWEVTDETVAIVDGEGSLKALRAGETDLKATYNEVVLTIPLKIVFDQLIEVVSMQINFDKTEIIEGSEIVLPLIATMSNATLQNISGVASWESSHPEIISILSNGVITPTEITKDPITITATFGDLTVEKAFTVKKKSKTDISVFPGTAMVEPGYGTQFELRQWYDNGKFELLEENVSWSAVDTEVAAIANTDTGSVRGAKLGTTIVKATLDETIFTARFQVVGKQMFSFTSDAEETVFFESPLAGNNEVNEIDMYAYLDSTSRNSYYSGYQPELKIYLKTNYDELWQQYNNTIEIRSNAASEGTYYASDGGFSIYSNDDDEEEGDIYPDYLTIRVIGDVGALVAGSFGYWSCDWETGCAYKKGEFIVDREVDLEPLAQGTVVEPIELGTLPLVKQKRPYTMPVSGYSYYKLQTVAENDYTVRINTSDYYELSIFETSDYSGDAICKYSSYRPDCSVTASGENLYVRVGPNDSSRSRYFEFSIFGAVIEGSLGEPKDILTGDIKSALVQAPEYDYSYYRIPVLPSSIYDVTGSHVRYGSDYGRVYMYSDMNFSSGMGNFSTTRTRRIFTQEGQEFLYVKFYGQSNGSYVDLTVEKVEFQNEGAKDTPIAIQANILDEEDGVKGQVGNGMTYFSVNVSGSEQYGVMLDEMLDNADLYVYGDPQYQTEICKSTNAGTNEEVCKLDSALTTLYIAVSGENATNYGGTDFWVYVFPYVASQGTQESPLSLGSAPLDIVQLTVGQDVNSYYSIDVTENTAYTIAANSQGSSARYYVYLTSDFSGSVCNEYFYNNEPESCNFETGTGVSTVYVQVRGYSIEGTEFGISIGAREFTSDGTISTPVNLGKPSISRSSEIGNSTNYYNFAAQSGGKYVVTVSNMFDDVNLKVYSDAFLTEICSSNNADTTNEECIVTATEEGKLYVAVDGISATTFGGSDFHLQASRAFDNQGATGAGNPLVTEVAPFMEKTASVAKSGISYYQTTVEIGKEYLVLADKAKYEYNMYISAYSDPDFTSPISCTQRSSYGVSGCLTTAMVTDTLYYRISNSSSTYGTDFKLSVVEKPSNQGDSITPVDLGAAPFVMVPSQVSSTGSSYYSVAVEEFATYRISLNGSNSYLDLNVYNDAGFSSAVSCSSSSSASKVCDYTTQSGETTLYLQASTTTTSLPEHGALFGITVSAIPGAQGTSSEPMELGVASFNNLVISTGNNNSSTYYSYYVVPVEANTEYSISIDNLSYANQIYVYQGEAFGSTACSDYTYSWEYHTRCDYMTNPDQTMLYISVRGYTSSIAEHATLAVEKIQ